MLSLSARTSPKRPRRATPQVDALEDIISLTGLVACPPCNKPPMCPPPQCPTIRVDVDIDQTANTNICAFNSNVSATVVQVAASNDTDVTAISVAGTIYVC